MWKPPKSDQLRADSNFKMIYNWIQLDISNISQGLFKRINASASMQNAIVQWGV